MCRFLLIRRRQILVEMFHPTLPLFHFPLLPDYPIMRDRIFAEPCYRRNPLSSTGHGPLTSDLTKFLPALSSPLTDASFPARNHHFLFDPLGSPSLRQFSLPPHYFANSARCCPAGSTFNMAELFPVGRSRCPLCIATPSNFTQADHLHVDGNTWKTMEPKTMEVPPTGDALSLKPTTYGISLINRHPLPFPPTLLSPWKTIDSVQQTPEVHHISSGKAYPSVFPSVVSLGKRRCIRCRCPNCMNPSTTDRPKGSKRKHICHYPGCKKVYGKTSHLRAHLRWHVGDRPFRCRWLFCRKSFTRSDELQRHLKTHTGDKKFLCRLCCKRFMRSDHLKKHLKTHQVRDTLAAAAAVGTTKR